MINSQAIRPSPLAGKWYPAEAEALREMLQDFLGAPLTEAENENHPHLCGLLAPHAGLRYSGAVAGAAFRQIIGQSYDTVVIIGPSHYPYQHPLLTTSHSAYQTPLGTVPIDIEALRALSERVKLLPIAKDPEHAIEIELPFLQVLLEDFKLLPLVMIDQSYAAAHALADALGEVLADQRVLYIASSDLSHFYDQVTAKELDTIVMDAVSAYDAVGVVEAFYDGRGLACGRGAIATVMLAAQGKGATRATLEAYATSGDVGGDYGRVVGYAAASFHA